VDDGYPELSSGSKRNYCRSIVRCTNWAEEQGYVLRTPLAHFRQPPGGSKELVVTREQYAPYANPGKTTSGSTEAPVT
jgi:hypothetical protein